MTPRPLRTDLKPVVEAVRTAGADAFVAVGDGSDAGVRYLTRLTGADRDLGLVVAPSDGIDPTGRAVLCAPASLRARAGREFVARAETVTRADAGSGPADAERRPHDGVVREVRTESPGDHPGERAAAVVREVMQAGKDVETGESDETGKSDETGEGTESEGSDGTGGTVLVRASIPHDAAVYLERAGIELASTGAVAAAGARKAPAERDRIRLAQRAAVAGVDRAAAVLAESELPGDGGGRAGDAIDDSREPLRWRGAALTADRLRREVNATLAARGVGGAGDTEIRPGPSTADRSRVDDPIRPGATVRVTASPRGRDGYRGDIARTFVVDGDGGWARRAHVAVSAAREAAVGAVEPGVAAATVRREAAAELAAYGFESDAANGAGVARGVCHGVGLSRREPPSGGTELEPGHVVAVGAGVSGPDGGVELRDLIVVTADGREATAEYPHGVVPDPR